MTSRLSANCQELTLEGTPDEWRQFSIALAAGQLTFPLDEQGDPAPYDCCAKRLVIEPTEARLGYFHVDPGPELRFFATPTGLQSLAGNALGMADGWDISSPISPHIHFDWISFGSMLEEGSPAMILEYSR